MHRHAVALVMILAAGCSDSATTGTDDAAPVEPSPSTTTSSTTTSTTVPTTTTTDAPTTTTSLAPGCGRAALPGAFTLADLNPAATRSAIGHVPPSYDPDTPTPVVLNFHGFTSGAPDQHGLTGFVDLAETEGFILVSPQGSLAPVFERTYWNTETGDPPDGFTGELVDDVAFIDGLIDDLTDGLCVDPDRIHATGLSNGGFFTSRLACDLSDHIASAATVGGVFTPPECNQERGVPMLVVHGTADPIVPFDASASTLGDVLGLDGDDVFGLLVGQREPIPEIVDDWAARNGCGEATTTALSATAERRDFADCTTPTAFVVLDGGGHTWPGTPPQFEALLGPTDQSFAGSEAIWAWFEEHPRTGG